jgi:alanine racemase
VTGRLTIDLDALAANYGAFAAAAAPAACAGVVKADAYGLGLEPVSRRLWREGCRQFFVANAAEGVALRAILPRARIFVFDGVEADTAAVLLAADLVPVLNDPAQLARWLQAAPGRPAALHVDTGMNRLGFDPGFFDPEMDGQGSTPPDLGGLPVLLLLTHLACADDRDDPFTEAQLTRFAAAQARFPGVPVSIGNSAGSLRGPSLVGDLARPGIGLYGCNPFSAGTHPLTPVVTLEGRVLQIRSVPAGTPIGYGGTHRTTAPTRLATVGVGYADGLLRALSNRGAVLFDGQLLPMLGRISMDLTVVDATGTALQTGDWVEFFGAGLPLDTVAAAADTVAYEILVRLGPRLERVYRSR